VNKPHYLALLKRIVIGVDPAVTASGKSDETGIIVAGLGYNGCAYVLDDLSGTYSPSGWSMVVIKAYWDYEVDRVVAEINQGGDMVESILRMSDPEVSYKGVRATRGKLVRAEPISALYEQKRVFHVKCFPVLENQMCAFTGRDIKSPDRVDALVWALTELMITPVGEDGTKIWGV
jgi:phage terminase large subunit-like protein